MSTPGEYTTGHDGRDVVEGPRSLANPDLAANTTLLAVAVWLAWLPVETRPFSGTVVAGTVLCLSVWGWRRSPAAVLRAVAVAFMAVAALGVSAGWGWDPARGVGDIGLLAGAVTLGWLASRSRPSEVTVTLAAIGLAGLAAWGLWQSTIGLESLRPSLAGLPEATRLYAEERLASRRAFASLPLPSHLAVLLATALPLLLRRLRATPLGVVRGLGAALCVAGLIATRSPIGVALGFGAAVTTVVGRSRRMLIIAGLLLVAAVLTMVALRPDVGRLEPVSLRLDNWRTATWLWSTAPTTGAGVGSFAQATQSAPLEVGNRPAHAHSLPMESLAELGPAGLIACVLLGLWLLRLALDVWPHNRELAVAITVVPLHNLIDFSFHVSGVVLPWAVLAGWATTYRCGRDESAPGCVRWGRTALVATAAVVFAMTVFHGTSVAVEQAAAASSRVGDRFEGALRALELAPWRIEPQFLLAAAALDSGRPEDLDRAWRQLDRSRRWRPRSAALAERRARLALARGDVALGLAELWGAARYGSPGSEQRRLLDELAGAEEGAASDPRR